MVGARFASAGDFVIGALLHAVTDWSAATGVARLQGVVYWRRDARPRRGMENENVRQGPHWLAQGDPDVSGMSG
jgi:hypothetical protein